MSKKKINLEKGMVIKKETKLGLVKPSIKIKQLLNSEKSDRIQKKYDELAGKNLGKLLKKNSSIWYFEGGCLCYNPTLQKVFEIHGDIYKKWVKLGGVKWGIPNTDEEACHDKVGRVNHFNGNQASIFWHPRTGANSIQGGIYSRWKELGYEQSYLGYPNSDEADFPDGGRVNSFEKGGIYWWSDTGAIDAKEVEVHYTGLICFKTTGEGPFKKDSDEPYVILNVASPFDTRSFRSKEYGGVDANTSRPDLIQIYKGAPNGLIISTFLFEADHGDKDKYQAEITKAFELAHKAGTMALKLIPVVGKVIAAVAGPLIQSFVPEIGKALTRVFGFGDDLIGRQNIVLTAKQMLLLAKKHQNSTLMNVGFKFQTDELRGHSARYRVYFGIV